ncbi:MAG: SRPBCC family protein [Solirubrobacterales bacterium]
MGPISAEISIDSPREAVFDLLCDLSFRPAFTDHLMEGFHLLRLEPIGQGAGARFHLRDGGWIDSVIEEVDGPHRLVERGRGGYLNRVPNTIEWLLSEAGGDACEVKVTFWTDPSRAFDRLRDAKASERRLGKGLRKTLERLRNVAESGAPPERITVAGADRI